MQHPYNNISMSMLKKLVTVFAFLTLLGSAVIYLILRNGPHPIELARLAIAWDEQTAQKIISMWTVGQSIAVAFLAGFNLLWGAIWINWLALSFIYLSRRIQDPRYANRGNTWAFLAWIVWFLNIFQSVSLYLMTLKEAVMPWPWMFSLTSFPDLGFALISLLLLLMWLVRAGKTEAYVLD